MSGTRVESELSDGASDLHRALSSLQEELEAVDYYHQRAEHARDPELKGLLLHNRDEEIEHAAMLTEWLRRRSPVFDAQLRTYLFTTAPVTDVEESGRDGGGTDAGGPDGSLGIGSLKPDA